MRKLCKHLNLNRMRSSASIGYWRGREAKIFCFDGLEFEAWKSVCGSGKVFCRIGLNRIEYLFDRLLARLTDKK